MKKGKSIRLILGFAALLVVAAAAIGLVTTHKAQKQQSALLKARADAILRDKDKAEEVKVGANARAVVGPNETRNPGSTPEVDAYLKRAFPQTEIPGDSTLAAQSGWAALNASAHSSGGWQLIGPSKATYPSVLTPFLGDGAQYVASGRVTAMGIGPSCQHGNCPIYVGAAGGGIWRTRDGLAGNPQWEFLSTSFGTNAIGDLLVAPNDSSGQTIYVGTGEPNASVDSEAGVGVYKSTDGGDTWALFPGTDIFFQRAIGRMAIDNNGNLLVPIASSVRGVSSTDGGASSSGATGHPLVTRGLYRCNGATCSRIFTAPPPFTRGSTTVKVDPTHPGIIYVNAFGGNFFGPGTSGGIWRSTDNGATFTQIFAPRDATANTTGAALERDDFDVTTLPSGATRMYVGAGEGGEAFNPPSPQATFWRSDNADTSATFSSFGGLQVIDYCGGQCWYDNLVYTPPNNPDIVYLGGSFDYNHLHGRTNGRAVLLSSDGGSTWSDLTEDGDKNNAEFTHPDQHAIITNPTNPYQYWEGSDGGVVRSDGAFADISYKCASRGLSASSLALCQGLLSRVPNNLQDLNNGLSTLQFQSLSFSPKRPQNNVQGGTQDNGTFQYTGSSVVWPQIIYGDGGQSGFNAADDTLRFNTFSGQANDANFHAGDPTKWVIISGPIITSPEGSYFYPPIIADPNPANAGSIFQGSQSVWRSQDWGGSQAFLEANCPEFTTSSTTPTCGDFVRIGDGAPSTDLTSGAWGSRAGGAVAWIARAAQNTGTMWVATGGPRVFIADNANDPAGSVHYNRVDPGTNDPGRFPTTIYVDPSNAHHAWISYSGYNVNTPATPGHVFEVTWSGSGSATFVDRSYNLPDFPITAVVRDDINGDLYASSDFGVMRLANGSTTWTVAGSGLPMVEICGLTIVPSSRILYAATHGRSAWQLSLP